MKKLLLAVAVVALTGCSTIKEYWPRAHDPALFNQLVTTDIAIQHIDCEHANWAPAHAAAEQLAQYAEWRNDPQATNLKGLLAHTERMGKSNNKVFCELGKKTAAQRIEAAKTAWQGR